MDPMGAMKAEREARLWCLKNAVALVQSRRDLSPDKIVGYAEQFLAFVTSGLSDDD